MFSRNDKDILTINFKCFIESKLVILKLGGIATSGRKKRDTEEQNDEGHVVEDSRQGANPFLNTWLIKIDQTTGRIHYFSITFGPGLMCNKILKVKDL